MNIDFGKLEMNIHHVAISVQNMEETIIWYKEKLGFWLLSQTEIPGQNVKAAHMQGPGFLLEIFEAEGAAPLPEGRSHPNTDFRTCGVKHFSISVKGARSFVAELEKEGVTVAFVAEVDGTYGAFILDNTGNLIEIFDNSL
jgi:catechol 2,3-dioxygenase-like lactoylglutathione lyase family enzyme